jgi:undecaprenyl-phosphate 4-deoxy-4-formamido-L-arabinose transferase
VSHLCKSLKDALLHYNFEAILVNDCSPDDSWNAIREQASFDSRIHGVNLRGNVGQDRAIMAGLNYAKGDYIVIMDDDLQHNPLDIPCLVDQIVSHGDVIYANFLEKKQTAFKNVLSWGAGKVAELVMKKPPHIYMSPFKIMKREIAKQIINYHGPFPYIDGILFQVTDDIHQICVHHHTRHEGVTTHTFWKQANLFLTLATNFSIIPLRFISIVGTMCAFLSFLLGFYFFAVYFLKGIVVVGWTALALINLFIGGMVMISLGIMGEYIGRILMNVNQSPQYVVKQTLNISADSE